MRPSIIPLNVSFNDLSSEHGILLQHGQLSLCQHDQQDRNSLQLFSILRQDVQH